MKKFLFALAILMPMFFLMNSCNDPTVIGSELLEQDEANLAFTDTLTLITQTMQEDSVVTYTIDNQYNSFPCGYFEDPIFGTIRSTIYSQFKEGSLDPPAFDNPVFDSLVLVLGFDTSRVYGVFDETYRLEIRELDEELDNSVKFYADQSFATKAELLGAIDFVPDPFSLDSLQTSVGGELARGFFVQIRLDDELGLKMLNDSWYEDGAFIEMMKGLEIKLANTDVTDGLMSFAMNSSFTRLRLFYTNFTSEPDTISTVYDFTVSGSTTPRHANMEHDFSVGTINPFFDSPSKGDSLLFLQGMAGSNISIEIPYLNDLGNIIANKAEMDFYVAELAEDDLSIYEPITQLVVAVKDADDEEFFLADDVVLNPSAFGGNLSTEEINGIAVQKYTVNIAALLNRKILEDSGEPLRFFLRAFPKQETTRRVILYGPKHSLYPAQLKLTYTNIDN